MRTLEEIRKKNKRNDLLLDGMESNPVCIPCDLKEYENGLYKGLVKPHVEDFFAKHIKNEHIQ